MHPEVIHQVRKPWGGAWWCTHSYNLSCLVGGSRRIKVKGYPGQKQETLSEKQTKRKGTGGTAEVVECLPGDYKALSSIPSTTKK
jgi:hypothetical protein